MAVASLVWSGLVFLVAGEILVEPVRKALFSWLPEWFDIGYYLMYPHMYKTRVRIFTWCLGILLAAVIGTLVEEFYFRSYLLPRMSALKWAAPLVGIILMSLYHLWSPWLFFLRKIAMLPMVYAVWWKKNIYIGIYAHCLLNLIGDVLMTIPIVFG